VPYSTPYPSCIFCGAKANSREHAIPKWISKRFNLKGFAEVLGFGYRQWRHQVSFASHRGHIFCKSCNAHFKQLEDEVIPLLVPMASGGSLNLDSEAQAKLALWAVKTTYALIAMQGAIEQVPEDHRRAVRELGRPVDEVWVAYVHGPGNLSKSADSFSTPIHQPLRMKLMSSFLPSLESPSGSSASSVR
jgi:hypothetical protein